ncbi:ABC transporter ATP-binding protein [Gordonia amicalis]|uniref:ABC transporter ATP-binding protein n=1 Tax=Gordonia amicalis TaxID=89053 RepID=UPI000428A549|nr:ABC transporter ATP-binding protein [Gordonia amicalis]MCZ0911001.1 ABC transporter ATP-binding protein [Gordonia amicalis]MDJ0453912.1 ABC transporter ATP-binding protein [Gordonia amicalis]MDV7077057.1 ABC transporter ATP-binding protein [Gordonia amicalis]UKO92468.1 ABC transporter ATP-binding protein [Gordonia amicalis]
MANSADPAVTVRNLRKLYPGGVGVHDISFTVQKGEIFGLLGPNGCGKTTAVECIGGLRRRDAGAVDVVGFDPADSDVALRDVLGFQPQQSLMPDKMRVAEALSLYGAFYRDPADPDMLLHRLGLADHRRSYFEELSGGQKQRLSVALALIGRPRVAILDELTTGLDPRARREVWAMLTELRDDGMTLLLVSHFMDEAEHLCDRVAVIDRGRVIALDTPEGLASTVATAQTLHFVPSGAVDPDMLRALPSVSRVDTDGTRFVVVGGAEVITDVVLALDREGVRATRLRVEQSNLEDAFVTVVDEQEATAPRADR